MSSRQPSSAPARRAWSTWSLPGPSRPMLEIVLVQPEIPPNAGNVIRLAANTGARLHLVGPLGFSMDHRQLRRAGLDYHDLANVTVHRAWKEFLKEMAERRMFAFTTKAKRIYADVRYAAGDVLVRSEEHTSELQSRFDLVCRLLLEKKKESSIGVESFLSLS